MCSMNFSTEFWVQIVIYGLSLGVAFGNIRTRLNYLEKKMDKYNNLQERMIVVEQMCKSAHHRLNHFEGEKEGN